MYVYDIEKYIANVRYLLGAHGVGHGVGMLFPPQDITLAVDVCAASEDEQFQYACATGVFMNAKLPVNSFSPCDENRYPAACYRFSKLFQSFELQNQLDIACSTQTSDYYRIGCAFGQGFKGYGFTPTIDNILQVCNEFIPDSVDNEFGGDLHSACLEGYFSLHNDTEDEIFQVICPTLEGVSNSYQTCMRRWQNSFTTFTMESDEQFYNYALLEKYYLPGTTPIHAKLPEKFNLHPKIFL